MTISPNFDPWWQQKLLHYGIPGKLEKALQKNPDQTQKRVSQLFDLISQEHEFPQAGAPFLREASLLPQLSESLLFLFQKVCEEKGDAKSLFQFIQKPTLQHYEIAFKSLPSLFNHLLIDETILSVDYLGAIFARLACENSTEALAFLEKYPRIVESPAFDIALGYLFEKDEEKAATLDNQFPFQEEHAQKRASQHLFEWACGRGNLRMVQYAWGKGNIDISSKSILNAAKGGNVEVFQFILNQIPLDEKINRLFSRGDQGHTPLNLACLKGNKRIVEFLLPLVQNALRAQDKASLLFAALEGKNPEICHLVFTPLFLSPDQSFLNWPRLDHKLPLEIACEVPDESVFFRLFKQIRERLGLQQLPEIAEQILYQCIDKNFSEIAERVCQELFQNHRQTLPTFLPRMNRLLLYALEKGAGTIGIHFVKTVGVNPSVLRFDSNFFLHVAAKKGLEAFLIFLIEKIPFDQRASLLEMCDLNGDTVLSAACRFGQEGIVFTLLRFEASLEFQHSSGENFFHLASRYGMGTLLKQIPKNETAVNQKGGPLNAPPIIYAMIQKDWSSVSTLLNLGAFLPSLSTPGISQALSALKGCPDQLLLQSIFDKLSCEIETSEIPEELDFYWLANQKKGSFLEFQIQDLEGNKATVVLHPSLLRKRSCYFAGLFNHPWKETITTQLSVYNLDDFYLLLNFLYGGNQFPIHYTTFKTLVESIDEYLLNGYREELKKWVAKRPECKSWEKLLEPDFTS